jgi:hypothetical protein
LTPRMEDREEPDLGPQVLGIRRDGAQSLAAGLEEDVVDFLLVLIRDGSNGLRHGEDHVEVLGVEELGLTVLQPLGARHRLALRAVAVAA